MPQRKPETVWVVVLVKSGIPTDVQVFRDLRSAQTREEFFRADINLNNDETGIFEVQIQETVAPDSAV